jgi:putative protease
MGRRTNDLDGVIAALEASEEKEERLRSSAAANIAGIGKGKERIGTVMQFYSKIGVAAIRLEGSLSQGEIIEIGTEEEAVRQRVASMQINREDVTSAGEGDEIGIKLRYKVEPGSIVYVIR